MTQKSADPQVDQVTKNLLAEANSLLDGDQLKAQALAEEVLQQTPPQDYKTRAEALIILAKAARNMSDYSRAAEYFGKARQLYQAHNHLPGVAKTLGESGRTEFLQGHYHKTIEFKKRSLEIYARIDAPAAQAHEYNQLGLALQNLGDLPGALENLLKAYDLLQSGRADQRKELAACLSNLAVVHKDMGQFEKALEYHQRTLELCQADGNVIGEAIVNCNIGVVLSRRGQKDKALEHMRRAVTLSQSQNNVRHEAIAATNGASLLFDLKQYDEAIEAYRQSLELSRSIALLHGETIALIGLARCYNRINKFTEAADYLQQAESCCDELDVPSQRAELFFASMELAENRGDHKTALEFHRKYFSIERERSNKRADEQMQNLRILHETEQAHKEAEIQRLANVELAEANERLEKLIRARNEFLGIAAHDLRNPLSNIRGLAQLAEREVEALTAADIRDICKDISASSARMLGLVNSLLDINRIDQGRLNVKAKTFDLAQLAHRYLSVSRAHAAAKDITIEFQGPSEGIEAYADPDIMVQVLDNLVSNAIKFSPNNTTVTIAVQHIGEDATKHARLLVRDQGPGLTEEDMQHLFGKFARLSAQPTGGEESSGLGLSIVKQLVETMHGRVWCESVHGQGASFIVELPVRPAAVQSGAATG